MFATIWLTGVAALPSVQSPPSLMTLTPVPMGLNRPETDSQPSRNLPAGEQTLRIWPHLMVGKMVENSMPLDGATLRPPVLPSILGHCPPTVIAVGTPIAGRPPHRSGLAPFGHPAPTSGV